MIESLSPEEYNSYYGTYISKVTNPNIISSLQESQQEFLDFMKTVPDEKMHYAYDKEKWTFAEVLQHILDTERIFNYRALCFARNDKTSLPGYEQDDYVPFSNAGEKDKEAFISDYLAVRNSSISLFRSFTPEMLQRIGKANGSSVSCRVAGFVIIGHQKHHLEVLKEQYLT